MELVDDAVWLWFKLFNVKTKGHGLQQRLVIWLTMYSHSKSYYNIKAVNFFFRMFFFPSHVYLHIVVVAGLGRCGG